MDAISHSKSKDLMLKRLVILNSKVYGNASIKLDDCESLQLIGPNNVGKSTLIYTLNFLFIIDRKKMTFSGNRSGDKETIHHYLPSHVNSYIVFEIFKERYYCILLKRNTDSELEYYKFDSEYRDEFFFEVQNDGQHKILKFNDLRQNLITSGLTLYPFKNKTEIFNFVYQRGKRNNGVVWLTESVVSDGLSNNFSKVYRYLINSKLITNKTLKDAIIIADNKEKDLIQFSHKSRREITDLLRINDEIKTLRLVQKEFIEFKRIYDEFNALTKLIAELLYCFDKQFELTFMKVQNEMINKKTQISNAKKVLDDNLNPRKQQVDQAIGGKKESLAYLKKDSENLQDQIDEINSFDDITLLNEAISNLHDQRKSIESKTTRIQDLKLSSQEIKRRIREREDKIAFLKKRIENYSSQLIHNITDKQDDKEALNYILSPEFSSLSSEYILRKISSLENSMKLFDGEIHIPDGIGKKEIESIESLKVQLDEIVREKIEFEELLPVLLDSEKSKKDLEGINVQIDRKKEEIRKILERPKIEKRIEENKAQIAKSKEEKENLEKELEELGRAIAEKNNTIQELIKDEERLENRIEDLKQWKKTVEEIYIDPNENETNDGLEEIYSKLIRHNKERESLKSDKDVRFESLKNKLKNTEANPALFIQKLEEEIACLPDKEKSINKLLQAISTQFSNPAHRLIRRYEEFRQFVSNKMNSKLGKIQISDIESLRIELIDNKRILDELRKISSIEALSTQISIDFEQSDNLKLLNRYLDSGKEIAFEDLFDIELHLSRDGKVLKRDLKKQVESDGTDRMIRLVIIMLIINRLAINDRENKIAIFIDEIASIDGHNRKELFKFCSKHNFIPICASTDETMLDGFDKYYMLFRVAEGKKTNITDKHNAMFRKEIIGHEAN